jgi:hypothetical protein
MVPIIAALKRPHPRHAAYVVAAAIALSFSYDLLRVPVQVSDSLGEILDAHYSPSVYASFVENATTSVAYLRPLRIAQIKALFDLAGGQHYWLVYRGFHAALLLIAVFLFVRVLFVTTWTDFAAAVFALTVLTGLHTFRGVVREGFPINHFLEIVVLCLVALNLARSRGGPWVDAAAAVTFVAASLVLESGLLVWVVLVTAWACGMRGVSRRGVIVVTALMGVYLAIRLLSTGTPGLGERSSGFLLAVLEPDELQQRFGANPTPFYAYNVAASAMSVLFSEPQHGVFLSVRAWLNGDLPPRVYVAIISSIIVTALILWTAATRLSERTPSARALDLQILTVCAAVVVANAVMSYAYTKDEIVTVAGALYAVAAFVAVRHAIARVRQSRAWMVQVAVCLVLLTASALWGIRSAGVHHMIRAQAFAVRNDWGRLPAARYRDAGSEYERGAAAVVRRLRVDALEMRVPPPDLLPRWADRWWGE